MLYSDVYNYKHFVYLITLYRNIVHFFVYLYSDNLLVMMMKRADALRDILEEEIVTGQLKPGERLDEATMAKRFDVSRTPIREAFLQLSAEGLIENEPRKGKFVAQLGPQRLMEMFEVAGELEGMCASFAARRASAEEVALIRQAHESCKKASKLADADGYYYENEIFHEHIREASHNQFLIEQARLLHRRLKPYRRLQLRARGRVATSLKEHDTIMTAIEESNENLAKLEMKKHVTVQGERFSDLLAALARHNGSSAITP